MVTNQSYPSLINGGFNFCVPLKMFLGFAEDFNKVIVNSIHELILLRSKDDSQIITFKSNISSEKCKLSILNRTWKVPHVKFADVYKLEIFKTINSRRPLKISFRSWDMYYNPSLPECNSILWNVKLARERSRFLLIAFRNSSNKLYMLYYTICTQGFKKVTIHTPRNPY